MYSMSLCQVTSPLQARDETGWTTKHSIITGALAVRRGMKYAKFLNSAVNHSAKDVENLSKSNPGSVDNQ